MAGKLIELKEAATMLGVTPDELVEMRSSGAIHGYRDGASWKFKSEEIERVASERGVPMPGESGVLSDLDLAIEGSSLNLADSSFTGLDGDLGLSSVGNDLNAADDHGDGSDFVLDLDDAMEVEEASAISPAIIDDDSVDEIADLDDMIELADEQVASPSDVQDEIAELMSDSSSDQDSDEDLDSILVSEESLGHSGETASSTIIGKRVAPEPEISEDSDIQLGAESKVEFGSRALGTNIDLVAGDSDAHNLADDIGLATEVTEGSNVEIASDLVRSDIDLVAGGSDLLTSGSDLKVESELDLSSGSELDLSTDSELKLGSDTATPGSDIELLGDSGGELDLGGDTGSLDSEIALVPDADGSGVNLVAGGSDIVSESDVLLGEPSSGSSTGGGSDTGKLLVEGSDLDLADGDMELALGSELSLEDDEVVSLDEDSGLELEPSEASGALMDSGLGSDIELGIDDDDELMSLGGDSASGAGSGIGSDIALDADDDDLDMMLAGSAAGSDLTLGTDSGINLSPTDSGLSLEEEPLDLGGSSIEQLELPEDDDDMISLEDADDYGQDAATQLKADDEFLLTPIEEAEDESSGSQVIALEDSEVYADENAQTMLGGMPADGGAPALVAEDADFLMTPGGHGTGATAQPVAMPTAAANAGLPEAKYSIWNVMSLLLVLFMLLFAGTLMFDLMQLMWEYDSATASASSSFMDSIIKAVNLEP